jgi:hypothetical protein
MARVTYSPQRVDEALALVFERGSLRAAAAETGIALNTLRRWVHDTHSARYVELVERLRASVDEQLIDSFHRNARAAAGVTESAIEKTAELLEQGDMRGASYASSTSRNLATTYGIATDKSLVMQGRPNQITRPARDLDDLVRELNDLVPGLVIDSTAEEVKPDRQLGPADDPIPDSWKRET